MSIPETEAKTVLTDVKAQITKLDAEEVTVKTEVKTWYEKHVPAIVGILALIVGLLVGHFVKL